MSGLEPLALIGAVAGLIQAFDSSIRIVKEIKKRRKAHGALPPPNLLEESFETGKREIENVLQEGTKRFGASFAEGDITARLALLQITVQTQNALLERLTQAREDDGIVDFGMVIDLSDQGRNDALLELRQLFSRRLKAEMALREEVVAKEEMEAKPVAVVQVKEIPPEKPASRVAGAQSPEPIRTRPNSVTPARMTPPLDRTSAASPSPPPSTVSRASTRFWKRKSTSTSISSMTAPSLSPDFEKTPTMTLPHRQHSINSLASTNTTTTSRSSTSPVPGSMPTVVEIQKYAGACKYAHAIREKGPEAGVRLQDLGMLYNGHFVYKCKSAHCEFQGTPVKIKRNWEIDTSVRSYMGLKYRWSFFAKSHVACPQKTTVFPYLCLMCTMLKRESQVYHGQGQLLAHIVSHQEQILGDVSLEGPLKFTNGGLKADSNDFDIYFPRQEALQRSDSPIQDANLRAIGDGAGSAPAERPVDDESDSVFMEPESNPWVSATMIWLPPSRR